MADWSQLPTELLRLISNRLNSDLYLLRFRSVCSTWRSSIPIPNPNRNPNPNHHHLNLPSKIPLFSNDSNFNDKSKTFSISKRTLFLVSPPPQNPTHHHHHYHPWIIKINNSNNQILYPLSYYLRFPPIVRRLYDFNDNSVVELDHEFVLRNEAELSSLPPNAFYDSCLLFRVVVFEIERCVFLLTVHDSGKLAVFRCGDDQWMIVPEMRTLPYDGVCVFKGKPIAVDRTGKTVRVRVGVGIEPELGLDLVAQPIFGGLVKYLVVSNGELLLVDKHVSCLLDDDDDEEEEEEEDNGERAVKFNVYRLDEKEKRWVEITSLGDRTLFVADDCAFFVSASDLGSMYRNCVIFRNNNALHDKCDLEMGVFDLDLRKQRGYYEIHELFWPPEWVWSR